MTPIVEELAEVGRAHAAPGAEAVVLPTRPDVLIVRVGEVVVKAHAPGMDPVPLRPRVAASALLGGVMLPPVVPTVHRVRDRLVTVWPAGEPVDSAAPDAAPWEAAGRLLAGLHAVPLGDLPVLPPAGGPGRVAMILDRLDGDGPDERAVRAAAATLHRPGGALFPSPGPAAAGYGLTHGDWHFGQLVRHPPGDGRWLLIDVDDLGHGDQAWDLARPAAWFACGLVSPGEWHRFLSAYLDAGGRALAGARDPWDRLDGPARALTVQLAAAGVAAARKEGRPLDEVDAEMVAACARIAGPDARTPRQLTQ